MAEKSARWVDELLPRVAVRQWVLTEVDPIVRTKSRTQLGEALVHGDPWSESRRALGCTPRGYEAVVEGVASR